MSQPNPQALPLLHGFGEEGAALLRQAAAALSMPFDDPLEWAEVQGIGDLPSVYGVTDCAAASLAVAALAVSALIACGKPPFRPVHVNRVLASRWFASSIAPMGWSLPPAWDALAGDYRAADGWIRLHTNAPHHRATALRALDLPHLGQDLDKAQVAAAVRGWAAAELETRVVDEGGCAAQMRSAAAWASHPQGAAVRGEPLVAVRTNGRGATSPRWRPLEERPLAGVRVLDLTRILAGPVASRFLAGYGAQVLRIDPIGWDEPSLAPEVTLGKRCARLDLRDAAGRTAFCALLEQADVLVHGYRADALERLGLGEACRRGLNPGLVDVSLNAYGFSGPWHGRRGFDSLVQMSTGIAEAGMRLLGRPVPTPLPVQALDHATGYLMAAAAVMGLLRRLQDGVGSTSRLSLARTAVWLTANSPARLRQVPSWLDERDGGSKRQVVGVNSGPVESLGAGDVDSDESSVFEMTAWGPARRLRPAQEMAGTPAYWTIPAGPLGVAPPRW